MGKSKKYAYIIDQDKNLWWVQVTRQVSSKKLVVSKEQGGFQSEKEAKDWAEEQLLEFASKQEKSNQRHGVQRKEMEEIRRHRSNRRADKTLQSKNNAQELSED